MAKPYIEATRDCVPDADEKIAFDKFHVAQHLGEAVDKVHGAGQDSAWFGILEHEGVAWAG